MAAFSRPITPRLAIVMTPLFALMAIIPLAALCFHARFWWPIVWVTLLYLGVTAFTVVLQSRNPSAALLMLRAFVPPSGCLGFLAGLFSHLAKHHQISELVLR